MRNSSRSKGIHQYAHGLGNANGVGQLHFAAIRQSCSNDVLGDVARGVSAGTVNLGGVFATEAAAAVTTHTAVAIYDNLAAGETGVAHGPAYHETAGWIDVVLGVGVEQFRWDGSLNHVLENVAAQLLVLHQL